MLPIIALGAVLSGTLLVGAAAAANTGPTSRSTKTPAQAKEPVVSPAAYLVVPMSQPEKSPKETPSIVELIGKMIF